MTPDKKFKRQNDDLVCNILLTYPQLVLGSQVEIESLDGSKETIKVQLHKNDLIGAGTQKILAKNIILKPASFNLKPGEEKEIEINIKVPAIAKAGNYCSLITVANTPAIKTVIEIEVTA